MCTVLSRLFSERAVFFVHILENCDGIPKDAHGFRLCENIAERGVSLSCCRKFVQANHSVRSCFRGIETPEKSAFVSY